MRRRHLALGDPSGSQSHAMSSAHEAAPPPRGSRQLAAPGVDHHRFDSVLNARVDVPAKQRGMRVVAGGTGSPGRARLPVPALRLLLERIVGHWCRHGRPSADSARARPGSIIKIPSLFDSGTAAVQRFIERPLGARERVLSALPIRSWVVAWRGVCASVLTIRRASRRPSAASSLVISGPRVIGAGRPSPQRAGRTAIFAKSTCPSVCRWTGTSMTRASS